jgi:hypothetical protein
MSMQPHMLCPHCLHALGAERFREDIILACKKCGCYWQYDENANRWYKYFD